MISSLNNGQIKHLNLLQKKAKARKEEKAFVIEGIKMFEESRNQGNLIKSYFSETFYKNKYKAEPEYFSDLSFEIVQDSVFNKLADTSTPQGVLAIVEMPSYKLDNIVKSPNSSLLILENIQDPGNLGTMIRTAEGAGFNGIILSGDSVDVLNPKTIRSTMGAIYRMPYVYAIDEDNFHEILQEIKNDNIYIYAAHLEGAKFYDKVDYKEKCAILIGNESNGLKEKTVSIADALIKIPMEGQVESLNASIAAAIIMYEVARQRRR